MSHSTCAKIMRNFLDSISDGDKKQLFELTMKTLACREVLEEKENQILQKRLQKQKAMRLRDSYKFDAYKVSFKLYQKYCVLYAEDECFSTDEEGLV